MRYYGLALLPVPVYLSGDPERLNSIPRRLHRRQPQSAASFGEWLFEEDFLEAIPIQTPHISGVAYVLPYRTALRQGRHRIYLKQMLLTERGIPLLPPWAFFLQCFLNLRGLRPTAPGGFYEDRALSDAREEFAAAAPPPGPAGGGGPGPAEGYRVRPRGRPSRPWRIASACSFQPLHEEGDVRHPEEVTAAERQRGVQLRAADEALFPFECQAKLRRFLPADLPVLCAMSNEVQFLRPLRRTAAVSFPGAGLHALRRGGGPRGGEPKTMNQALLVPAGAHGGNLIAGKGRYIAHVIESAAINRKSEEVNR